MTKEKLLMWAAWKMPRMLVYWCSVRLMSSATVGEWSNQSVPDLTCVEALRRWRLEKEKP